jgi:hypothetical protein
MNINELFERITKIVASPHTTVLEEDKKRAVAILMSIEEYMIKNYMNEHGEYEQGYDCDFGLYASNQLMKC